MKIKMTSVYVDDQSKALRFYTEVLGFAKKTDFSNGLYRWLTVASPEEPDGTELQLALNNNPAAKAYQQATRRRVHHAAHRRDRLDHRDAERHLWQPHSAHPAGPLFRLRIFTPRSAQSRFAAERIVFRTGNPKWTCTRGL